MNSGEQIKRNEITQQNIAFGHHHIVQQVSELPSVLAGLAIRFSVKDVVISTITTTHTGITSTTGFAS